VVFLHLIDSSLGCTHGAKSTCVLGSEKANSRKAHGNSSSIDPQGASCCGAVEDVGATTNGPKQCRYLVGEKKSSRRCYSILVNCLCENVNFWNIMYTVFRLTLEVT
jgi:hypothetical protein